MRVVVGILVCVLLWMMGVALASDFCRLYPEGTHCDGNELVRCTHGVEVRRTVCANGCETSASGQGVQDRCALVLGDVCGRVGDGQVCKDRDLIKCMQGVTVARTVCKTECVYTATGLAECE